MLKVSKRCSCGRLHHAPWIFRQQRRRKLPAYSGKAGFLKGGDWGRVHSSAFMETVIRLELTTNKEVIWCHVTVVVASQKTEAGLRIQGLPECCSETVSKIKTKTEHKSTGFVWNSVAEHLLSMTEPLSLQHHEKKEKKEKKRKESQGGPPMLGFLFIYFSCIYSFLCLFIIYYNLIHFVSWLYPSPLPPPSPLWTSTGQRPACLHTPCHPWQHDTENPENYLRFLNLSQEAGC